MHVTIMSNLRLHFYGSKSNPFVKERRPSRPPKPSSSSRMCRERTMPIRAKSSIPVPKKVALQLRQEETVRSGVNVQVFRIGNQRYFQDLKQNSVFISEIRQCISISMQLL